MTALGSVFLGDAKRQRILSSSSTPPPSPPPPHSPPSLTALTESQIDSDFNQSPTLPLSPLNTASSVPPPFIPGPPPPEIDPVLSLQLRVRWLEALLLGVKQDGSYARDRTRNRGKAPELETPKRDALIRSAEEIQKKLDAVVESNEGLQRFMEHYDQYAHLLTPSFALSGALPNSSTSTSTPALYAYENMTSIELEALLSEMELDIRAADRDLRELDALEKRGVTGAGKLPDHEALKPRLEALVEAHEVDLRTAAALEKRIGTLLERYTTGVDALSELFVEWNDAISTAEDRVTRMERERDERRRLGF